jgi:hypothetical protein
MVSIGEEWLFGGNFLLPILKCRKGFSDKSANPYRFCVNLAQTLIVSFAKDMSFQCRDRKGLRLSTLPIETTDHNLRG